MVHEARQIGAQRTDFGGEGAARRAGGEVFGQGRLLRLGQGWFVNELLGLIVRDHQKSTFVETFDP